MTIHISESGSTLARKDDVWEAVLITPGKGSSGIYTEEMLREHGPKAFPAGTHSYVGHMSKNEVDRDPKNLMGVLTESAQYVEGRGLVGKIKVLPHWSAFAEAVAPYTGLSISALGEGQEDENGEVVVESLIPDIMNTVDLVSYAGRGGSLVEQLRESAIKTSLPDGGETGPAPADRRTKENKEQTSMEIEELATKVDELAGAFQTLAEALQPVVESLKPEEHPEVDVAAAVESAIDKADEAGLPKELRAPVIEAAKTGADVDAAIAGQKAIVDAVKASVIEVEESLGGRFGSGELIDASTVLPKGW